MARTDIPSTPACAGLRAKGPTMISPTKAMARALLFVLTLLALFGAAGAQAQSNAAFVAQSVPAAMVTGTVYNVTVTMKNTGGTTWTSAGRYTLGSQGPQDNVTWGGGRVALPTPVASGGQASFAFQVTAPTTPGSYNFQWRMLQEGVAWFGALSPKVAVTVSAAAPRNDAQLIGVSVPAEMKQGQSYTVAVTMKNAGNTTWTAGSAYKLGSAAPHDNLVWGVKRVALGSNVVPGQQTTFSFPVVAPAAGSYTMRWQMVQDNVAWFGAASNSPVTVSAASPAPTISVTRSPATMTAGQPYSLTWRSTNATSVRRACTASGSGFTVNDAPAINGSVNGTASAAWINYPSTCTWTASGAVGSATFRETMVTNAAATGEVVTYIHTDGLGSPVARTDAAGRLISRTRYEPYGLTAGGATPTIGFTGHVNDADTGLVYMQQRYYDPVAGRFLSIDPVTTDANSGGSFNRYAYANNSPYKYIDPDGRDASDFCGSLTRMNCGTTRVGSTTSNDAPRQAAALTGALVFGGLGALASIGCDAITWSLCIPANPAIVGFGAAGGALLGAAAGPYLHGGTKALSKAMVAAGNYVRPKYWSHHHIVAQDSLNPFAVASRGILEKVGMNINSSYNGILMHSTYHDQIHTSVYHAAVNQVLMGASSYGDVALRLTAIRVEINMGAFPW